MTATGASWDAATFDRIYAADSDPWGFHTSTYERDKYATTLAALRGRRFEAALEVGCSIGVLTRALARSCRTVLALDLAEAALATARTACAGLDGVRFERRQIPLEWPDDGFDLIVLSEVLYFLAAADIAASARHAVAGLRPGGVALLVNWTGSTDTPCTGTEAAARFEAAAPTLRPALRVVGAGYRLDLLASAR